jgi:hypothetical protein
MLDFGCVAHGALALLTLRVSSYLAMPRSLRGSRRIGLQSLKENFTVTPFTSVEIFALAIIREFLAGRR